MDFISDEEMKQLETKPTKEFLSDKEMESMSAKSDFISDTDMEQLEKHKTDWKEDIGIGLTTIKHAGMDVINSAAGGVQAMLGNQDRAAAQFKQMEARQAQDELEASQREQGIGGKFISGAASFIPAAIAAPIIGPIPAGVALSGILGHSQATKNLQAGASLPQTFTQMAGEVAMDSAAMAFPMGRGLLAGAGWGAGGNVLSQAGADILGHATMPESAMAPYRVGLDKETAEKYGLAAGLGGGMGAVVGRGNKTGAYEPKAPTPDPFGVVPEFKATPGSISKGEYDELSTARANITDKLTSINNDIAKWEEVIGRTGQASDEIVTELNTLETALNKAADDLVSIDKDLSGDITDQVNAEQGANLDARKQEIIAQLKARRLEQTQGTTSDFTPPSDTISKTPPMETALTKIQEAQQDTPEKLQQRIQDATSKLEEIGQDESRSSLRESLNREIDAYEAIQRGEQPDLSWAGVKEPPTPLTNKEVPSFKEIRTLLDGHNKVGDVLSTLIKNEVGTPGQRQLLSALNRLAIVKEANFTFGKEFEIEGRGKSTGAYDSDTHTVEIHDGASIKTVLHESVHAATHMLIEQGKSKHAAAIKDMYNEYKQLDKQNRYGFTNEHEFVSAAFTDPSFQKFLQDTPSTRVGYDGKLLKLWDVFKQTIKKALGGSPESRRALDDVLDAGSALMETAGKKKIDEGFWQKLSDKQGDAEKLPAPSDELPDVRTVRGLVGRNFFGKNAMEGFYRDHPIVQKAYHEIRQATESAERISNELWFGTKDVIAKGETGYFATLSKVKDKSSAIVAVMTTSNKDMAALHEVFKKGFEEGKDYATNLRDNGTHLNPEQVKVYETLSKLFQSMYDQTVAVQQKLGKKHILPYREGWYPAKRQGNYSVEVSYKGNLTRKETFPTRHAADLFRKKITNGKNLKFLEVTDVIDASKVEQSTPNVEMAQIIEDQLAKRLPGASDATKKVIDDLIFSMQSKGGKLGYHHQHRMNVKGYKGTELFRNQEDLGGSFKEGIQGEVNNFGMNLRSLMIKTALDPYVTNREMQDANPIDHAAVSQMYDSAMGRNKDFFEGVEKGTSNAIDKMVNHISIKVLGKQFEARKDSAAGHVSNTAMQVFYAAKMVAKPAFVIAQFLTSPLIIPEMARDGHGLRAFHSFGKGVTKLITGDKVLWDHLKEVSQTYNVMEPQFRESMNLAKHTGTESRMKQVLNTIEDTLLLGKVGQTADAMSRLISYATAYTHFRDLGQGSEYASYNARMLTDKAMNVYDSSNSAPMFEKMGVLGNNMKPLSSFSLNQLGNFVSYIKDAKKGNYGPLIAYGMIVTAMGGVMSLPFIQEYERFRGLADKFFDITMPSILEIFSGDESFLDRLNITGQDAKDVAMYGIPALSGIDLSSSMRSNETMISLMAAIALGQDDVTKLLPILTATAGTVGAIPGVAKTIMGKSTVGEGRKAVEAIVSGPIGYGAKEALGLNETKYMGESTGMIPTGKQAKADIPRTGLDVTAGLLGTKTIEQKRKDQKMFENVSSDKKLAEKIERTSTLFTETGDKKYLQKLIDYGLDGKQIQSAIDQGAYDAYIDQEIRYIRNRQGTVNPKKAVKLFNFGIKE